ncbi:uncharacterized protein LOC134445496 [Engraulis encrasicolus]|uniref:uncharacterized protein LOC134445496 n=1 Tax=Engraulis encrasicolus TaxID=184585 RepID=UPI002FD788EA
MAMPKARNRIRVSNEPFMPLREVVQNDSGFISCNEVSLLIVVFCCCILGRIIRLRSRPIGPFHKGRRISQPSVPNVIIENTYIIPRIPSQLKPLRKHARTADEDPLLRPYYKRTVEKLERFEVHTQLSATDVPIDSPDCGRHPRGRRHSTFSSQSRRQQVKVKDSGTSFNDEGPCHHVQKVSRIPASTPVPLENLPCSQPTINSHCEWPNDKDAGMMMVAPHGDSKRPEASSASPTEGQANTVGGRRATSAVSMVRLQRKSSSSSSSSSSSPSPSPPSPRQRWHFAILIVRIVLMLRSERLRLARETPKPKTTPEIKPPRRMPPAIDAPPTATKRPPTQSAKDFLRSKVFRQRMEYHLRCKMNAQRWGFPRLVIKYVGTGIIQHRLPGGPGAMKKTLKIRDWWKSKGEDQACIGEDRTGQWRPLWLKELKSVLLASTNQADQNVPEPKPEPKPEAMIQPLQQPEIATEPPGTLSRGQQGLSDHVAETTDGATREHDLSRRGDRKSLVEQLKEQLRRNGLTDCHAFSSSSSPNPPLRRRSRHHNSLVTGSLLTSSHIQSHPAATMKTAPPPRLLVDGAALVVLDRMKLSNIEKNLILRHQRHLEGRETPYTMYLKKMAQQPNTQTLSHTNKMVKLTTPPLSHTMNMAQQPTTQMLSLTKMPPPPTISPPTHTMKLAQQPTTLSHYEVGTATHHLTTLSHYEDGTTSPLSHTMKMAQTHHTSPSAQENVSVVGLMSR